MYTGTIILGHSTDPFDLFCSHAVLMFNFLLYCACEWFLFHGTEGKGKGTERNGTFRDIILYGKDPVDGPSSMES